MKEKISNLFSLGLGIAVVSKETIEKTINEFVEKGKITKRESAEIIEEIIQKGQSAQDSMESFVKEKISLALKEMDIVTKDEFDKLKERIESLEKKPEE